MSMEMWSQLKKFSNGESLDAETLNVPIGQLGDRTSYLYARLKELFSEDPMSSVILTEAPLSAEKGEEPEVGNAVYLDKDRQVFAAAKATMDLYDDFKAADSAFTVGILQTKDGNHGNVLLYGNLTLNPDGSPIPKTNMIESGEEFRAGRYYLSANEAGRLTANPNGPVVYVCTISGGVNSAGGLYGNAIVSPQYLDVGTSHVHRTATITARPAGTYSTAGYLPIDDSQYEVEESSDESSSGSDGETIRHVGPLALRFGGTWTANGKIDYSFWLENPIAAWPRGVVLCWKENGGPLNSVNIPAPDVEVPISNGLTVRLSMQSSGPNTAYPYLSDNQRRWETLTFPDAGRGWLDHEMFAVASGSVDGFKVAIRGRLAASHSQVNVAFPSTTDVYEMDSILDGSVFGYEGRTYQFTRDVESYSSESGRIPVALGPCLADSALYLAEAIAKSQGSDSSSEGASRFAVLGAADGASASLLIMDGMKTFSAEGAPMTPHYSVEGRAFDVVGGSGINMVVFDSAGRVLGSDAVVEGAASYSWKDIGNGLQAMVYQDVADVPVTVPAGTVVSAEAVDYEPDALYDYVIGMDPQIANYWPPVPPKSAALVVNGVEMDNKALVPWNPTVSFGKDTIHWFEDDEGRKPWPEAFVRRGAYIDPAYDKAEVMHWIRGFQGATGPVTSLQVREGSPLKIYGYGTNDVANVGDLEIAADFDFRMENGGAPGYNVPKRAMNGRLVAGPVVERIVGGAGVSVISSAGCPDGQGTVMIALDNGSYRNQFADIALENAEQAKVGMFPYIRLKGYSTSITSPSAFTATMRVPTNLPDGKYALSLFAAVFGEDGFTSSKRAACVRFSYNILPDFTAIPGMAYRNLKTTLLKPDMERNVFIPFGHEGENGIVYNGFDPVLVTTDDAGYANRDDIVSDAFGRRIPARSEFAKQSIIPELRPGYLVGIRIARSSTRMEDGTEPYTGPIGFINLSWAIVSAD